LGAGFAAHFALKLPFLHCSDERFANVDVCKTLDPVFEADTRCSRQEFFNQFLNLLNCKGLTSFHPAKYDRVDETPR
jgi:ubiquitin C-terminal hydrolase